MQIIPEQALGAQFPVINSDDLRASECASAPTPRSGGGLGARSAPLILIEEHLTDVPPSFEAGQGFRRGNSASGLMENWFFPCKWNGPEPGELSPVLKIQSFKSGGYEASIRMLNLRKIGAAIEFGGRRGKREAPESPSRDSQIKAGQRAKRKVRHSVKNMGATNLATFSKREGPNTGQWSADDWQAWESGGGCEAWQAENGQFWTDAQWSHAWDLFRRNYERANGGKFPYVAILERHRKGNFHLHVAWLGKVNLNVVRPLWWACCGGRGQGNVQAEYIKAPEGCQRSDKIARYISKYVSKMFEDSGRFNKKRYWASKQSMAEARRYVLAARTLDDAMQEMRKMLGLDFGKFLRLDRGRFVPDSMFMFPDGSGVWLNVIPDIHLTEEPPF